MKKTVTTSQLREFVQKILSEQHQVPPTPAGSTDLDLVRKGQRAANDLRWILSTHTKLVLRTLMSGSVPQDVWANEPGKAEGFVQRCADVFRNVAEVLSEIAGKGRK